LKKNGGDLVKHTHVIAKGGENRRESLPPPPVFLSQMTTSMSIGLKTK
jgi:hypothetical protein